MKIDDGASETIFQIALRIVLEEEQVRKRKLSARELYLNDPLPLSSFRGEGKPNRSGKRRGLLHSITVACCQVCLMIAPRVNFSTVQNTTLFDDHLLKRASPFVGFVITVSFPYHTPSVS